MARLSTADLDIVGDLSTQLATIHLDDRGAFGPILDRIRSFMELDNLLVFCPQERLAGWGVERIEASCLPNPSRGVSLLVEFLARAPYRFWFFDPLHPESDQRDRVVETIELVGATAYRNSQIYRDVLVPLRLHEHRELRVLICDGPVLLGWVGSLHGEPLVPEQRMRLAALVPALRRRLAADRMLRRHELSTGILATVMDRLAEPAFVLGATGDIRLCNRAARERLEQDREATSQLLTSALRGGAERSVKRIALGGATTPPALLVTLEAGDVDERVDARVRRASADWSLTPRQREVLSMIARGHPNASIAAHLGIGERAVELHVTVLLERSRVHSRAALVAMLLAT